MSYFRHIMLHTLQVRQSGDVNLLPHSKTSCECLESSFKHPANGDNPRGLSWYDLVVCSFNQIEPNKIILSDYLDLRDLFEWTFKQMFECSNRSVWMNQDNPRGLSLFARSVWINIQPDNANLDNPLGLSWFSFLFDAMLSKRIIYFQTCLNNLHSDRSPKWR